MQSVMQSIQQAYLGTGERALSCSKAGVQPVRAELFAGSVGRWTREVSRYIRLPRHYRTNAAGTICNAFGKSYRTPNRCFRPLVVWASLGRTGGGFCQQARMAEGLRRDQRIRTHDGRGRHSDCEMLLAHRRFKDRFTNPLKRWKLSYEDFRNRSRWAEYEGAIEDMMEKKPHQSGLHGI